MALEQTVGRAGEAPGAKPDKLDKAFSLIFELAKEASAGDELAQLGSDYLKNVQLTMNENLRLETEVTRNRFASLKI